jgi:hypothetical protein
MSSFAYPGKDRLAPRLRRIAGGAVIAGVVVAAFFLAKPHIDDATFEALLALTPLSKEKFQNLVANPWAFVVVFSGLTLFMSTRVVVDVLEFHFFPRFDDETLRRVGEKTGLLRWVDFEDSPAL